MNTYKKYPVLEVNLEAIESNALTMANFCSKHGIDIAGVIKFSDGDLKIAEAYHKGGCKQIASSRVVQLERIKQAIPNVTTMLIRIPMISELTDVVKWCDISLNSEEKTLRMLELEASKQGTTHKVVLMLDVGDRREGVFGIEELCRLAMIVENELEHIELAGVGSSFACVSGVLPDWDNLRELAECARKVEKLIGRKLEIVSGGSSISLTLLANNKPVPPEINHLRIGGSIANPMAIRQNRGVVIPGMREDTFKLITEIIEIGMKPSVTQGSGKNWAGQIVEFEDLGVRKRAIIALGSQDVGDATSMIPMESGIKVLANSSDHTVLDITESERDWKVGDKIEFALYYMHLLYCFATRNVNIVYK